MKITRVFGDNSPLNMLVAFNDVGPVDLSAYTVKISIEKEDGTAIVTAATTGINAQPTQTFTASASTDRLTCYQHGVKHNNQLLLTTTAADLPAPLAIATRYFAVNVSDVSFQLASEPSGAAINITDAGTGVHSFKIVGSLQYSPQSTYAVGLYRCWIELVGSTTAIVPEREIGVELEIVRKGN